MKLPTVRAAFVAAAIAASAGPASGVTLGVDGRANATPSIAAIGQLVVVAWGATTLGSSGSSGSSGSTAPSGAKSGTTDVYVAVSRDGGRRFGPPHRVNDVDGEASLGGEQPPHVALVPGAAGREPSIVVVWTAKQRAGTRILFARSDDGGSTFGRARPFAGGEAAGNRGWEAITTDRDGQVVAVWLDHRELAASGGSMASMPSMPAGSQGAHDEHHEGHDHGRGAKEQADGVARAQLSKLYFSREGSHDQGQPIAAGVCYCCKTAVTSGPDGSLYAAWRHVYPGNIRDIAFTLSRDGGRTFAPPLRVSDDDWVLDGCPENGPAMAVDRRNRVHVVWPTLVKASGPDAEPSLALFYAVSSNGRSFSPRLRLPAEGLPRHVQIVTASDDSLVAVWEEQTSRPRRIVMGRAHGDRPRFTREVVSDAGPAVYPVVASAAKASVAAWTSEATDRSVIQVKRFEE